MRHWASSFASGNSLPTGSKAFSWTPATMIAVAIVGLILFFVFTANHP
jgi:hypothetical protein